MRLRGRVAVRYPSEGLARAVEGAVRPENAGFVRARVEPSGELVAEAEAASAEGLLRTLDDFLACLSAAEAAARAGEQASEPLGSDHQTRE